MDDFAEAAALDAGFLRADARLLMNPDFLRRADGGRAGVQPGHAAAPRQSAFSIAAAPRRKIPALIVSGRALAALRHACATDAARAADGTAEAATAARRARLDALVAAAAKARLDADDAEAAADLAMLDAPDAEAGRRAGQLRRHARGLRTLADRADAEAMDAAARLTDTATGLTPAGFLRAVAALAGADLTDLRGHARRRAMADVRFAALVAVAIAFPRLSTPALGRLFNRDHTTVLHAFRRVAFSPGAAQARLGDAPRTPARCLAEAVAIVAQAAPPQGALGAHPAPPP